MRVRFGGASERGEAERRRLDALDARIDAWLSSARSAARAGDWWRRSIRAVHPALDAEPWADGRVVVRCERRDRLPIAERVVRRAEPQLGLTLRRPALSLATALERTKARYGVDLAAARVRAGFARGHLIDVVFHVPGGVGPATEPAASALLADLLGEQRAEDWIGRVSVVAAPRGGPLRVLATDAGEARLPLAELAPAVEAAICGVYAELPRDPWCAAGTEREWTMFELEPEVQPDWAAQDDLVMATTCVPELLKSFLEDAPFSSLRFSRHGELFAHLKYEMSGDTRSELRRRVALEDALDAQLARAGAGRVVGGGLGLRYAYVNLALLAEPAALEVIRERARGAGLPARSWVQPFDSDLRSEWFEVWEHAPAPPELELED